MSSDSLVSFIQDIFEKMNRESHYMMVLSFASLVIAPFAILAGSNLLWVVFQPGFAYYNYPSVNGILVISAYFLILTVCWTIFGCLGLKLAYSWRVRLKRLEEGYGSLSINTTEN